MTSPNTPHRAPFYDPPSYGEDNSTTPVGESGNPSQIRLLTSLDEPTSRQPPYVSQDPVPRPLRIQRHLPGRLLRTCVSTPGHLKSLKEEEKESISVCKLQELPKLPNLQNSSRTTRLQKKPQVIQKSQDSASSKELEDQLPSIPDGPSRRRSLSQSVKTTHFIAEAHLYESSLHKSYSPLTPRRSYQPTVTSSHSRAPSIIDNAPSMGAPESSYNPYSPTGRASPTRSWESRGSSDFKRPPPASVNFEPPELNGAPRPGTPSSRYGGSPRRPLPPAPLFSGPGAAARNSIFADDATISIPLEGDIGDGDDVFGPDSPLKESRHGLTTRDSYMSSSTLADDHDAESEYYEHYGPAPDGKQERRGARQAQMAKKEVRLINGELILECKIPTILYSFLPRRDEIEFTHMRYTAVTCDPDDFVSKGYKLRQNIGTTARETELFICVTMYNEDEINFTRTMHAVMKNISHFCSRSKSRTWGEHGWQKIVVCVVSDGRQKIHPRTLDALAAMGVYQDGIAKNLVNQKEVQAHVYEYTTQVSLDSDLKFKGAEKGIVPVQMIFCLKEKNAKKLNSHRWFFNAFGRALTPNICILLDVGTKPGGNSLYHLWKAFDTDSNVAGACGEIKAMKGKFGAGLLNPLVASQNFEYKMSNILDKPLESVFGYITVLPGALSAYRYHALQNDHTGHGPLSQYFKGETLHGQNADVFTANMYLAEDRILCWELVAKRDERWLLKYVKSCTGETDVPGKLFA